MSKNKDLLLQQALDRAPRYSLSTRILKTCILPIALVTDAVCYISASTAVFNETLLSSVLIALTGTVALDVPMSIAGEQISRPDIKNRAAKRLHWQLAGLFGVFLTAYLVYIFLLSYQFAMMEDVTLMPLIGRCLLPAVTSAACFFTALEANPTGTRAALLERQMLELKQEIYRAKAEVQRAHECLRFDPARFDQEQLRLAMQQAELAELEECLKLRTMLAENLPTKQAVQAFLIDNQLDAPLHQATVRIRENSIHLPISTSPESDSDISDQDNTVSFHTGT